MSFTVAKSRVFKRPGAEGMPAVTRMASRVGRRTNSRAAIILWAGSKSPGRGDDVVREIF